MAGDDTAGGVLAGDDTALAVQAAVAAGRLLMKLRTSGLPSDTAESADDRSDRLIAAILADARPDDAILSEEIASRGDRLTADRVWIVDPLDGTREYGETGRDDWAVHVALWERGALVAGAVALPAREEVWSSADRVDPATADRSIRRIVVSRSRPPRWALSVAAELGAEVVPMGSAGAKVAAVLRGDADAYLHDGGQYEWDSAAPVAVAAAQGWFAARADGTPLLYNQRDAYLPDLLVCPPAAAPDILARIARNRNEVATPRPK